MVDAKFRELLADQVAVSETQEVVLMEMMAGKFPRFRCRECRRTFTRMSGTPMADLRLRGKWEVGSGSTMPSAFWKASRSVPVPRNVASRFRRLFFGDTGFLNSRATGNPLLCKELLRSTTRCS